MCGIVGFYGQNEEVLDTLISGLRRLEYRGYDSAGVATITTNGDIFCQKAVGKIINLEKKLKKEPLPEIQKVGIAHTRWATHGIPTEANCHPHSSQNGKIWLVHNGIIENYKELKEMLESEGVVFKSQTDTEVIAHLVNKNYKGDLKEAVLESLKDLEGAFALAIISADEPDRLIGAKMGSPLVLGVSDDNKEYILASDVSAIISRTRQVIFLEDGELIDIKDGEYTITNFEDQILNKEIETVDWDTEAASKEGFDHFLIKEINEQPKTITDSCRGRLLPEEGDVRFGGLMDVKYKLKDIERVVILGIGTAYYAAKLGEMYFEDIAGIPAKAEMTPEFRYKNPYIDEKTWVIAVSQSGETADTIAAIQEAKNRGALVTGLVNSVGSTISRITEAGVYNHIGPEISVASTKAFTSQSVLLLMHAIMLGRMRGLSLKNGQRLVKAIQELPQKIEKALAESDNIKELAQKYQKSADIIYMGRNYNHPIALEGALKLKEVSYIHAEGLSGGELKHGFIALIDENVPTVAIATKDSIYEKQLSNIEEVKARSGKVLAIGTEGDEKIKSTAHDVIFVPATEEETSPILNAIPLQLLAYHITCLKGYDVDKPRNLAKSVTVE